MKKKLNSVFHNQKIPGRRSVLRRCLPVLLSACMLVTFMPSAVFAVDSENAASAESEMELSADSTLTADETAAAENSDPAEAESEENQIESSDEETQVQAFSDNYKLTKSFTCKNKGYRLLLPSDAAVSTYAGDFDGRVTTNGCVLEITKEWSPYYYAADDLAEGISQVIPDYKWKDGRDQYFGFYQSRFLLNKDWQKNNGVNVSSVENISTGNYSGIIFSAVISDLPDDLYDGYTYIYLKMNSHFFLRIAAKYHSSGENPSDNGDKISMLRRIASTLSAVTIDENAPKNVQTYKPERKDSFSEETQKLYDRIKNVGTSGAESETDQSLLWGIYSDHVMQQGIDETIPALEKRLGYNFSVVLAYVHYNGGFPSEFMQKASNQGKIVELTYQLTENNNENLYADSVSMRIYRRDPATIEKLHQFARDAKALGHPFLFRLCNEMNSDWTSYGGVVNMADPDIFVENWRTIYQIFREEGVDNCIWIYNPNNRNAPPDDWNGALNYYPGNEYVDLIGVTGYNTGTYYYSRWLEEWRGFTEIYDDIQAYYGKYFSSFPWMITEFSTSSYGGDKPEWIRSMFRNIGKYKNIKIAVWFNFADYDENGVAARPYWLDETVDCLMAFRHGLTGAPDFRDLEGSEWAVDAICDVTDAGYFTGTSDTTFDPGMDMSRAMIYTVIARMAGEDTSTGSEWYEAGMNWAVKQGITDGSNPFDSITREQLVTMLYRYATGDTEIIGQEPEESSDPADSQNPDEETADPAAAVSYAGENNTPAEASLTAAAADVSTETETDGSEPDEEDAQPDLTGQDPNSADGGTEPAASNAGEEENGTSNPDPEGQNSETVNPPSSEEGENGENQNTDPIPKEEIDLSTLSGFADAEDLSVWAGKAMVWAVENGIITGDDRGYLNPQSMATRAQVAAIISRFAKLLLLSAEAQA